MKELSFKVYLAIEILRFLSRRREFVSTTELFNQLVSAGILENSSADRKKLQRTLSELAEAEFLLKRFEKFRGKKPQEWKFNHKRFPYLAFYSEEELLSFFFLISFVPKKYRDIPVLQPAIEAVNRFGNIPEEKKKRALEAFDYLPIPIERYSGINRETLSRIFNAIVERHPLLVTYADEGSFKIYPIKVFHYNGFFYMGAVEAETKRYRVFKLISLSVNRVYDEQFPAYFWVKYHKKFFPYREEPFVFKLELPADYMSYLKEEHTVTHYPTQFHMELKGDSLFVWLVGFNSYRFASWIILDEIKAVYRPAAEDVELARAKELSKVYDGLSYSLRENLKRFKEFKEEVRKFFERRKSFYDSLLRE
ncbi:helix-turn-helix transcriptional regulator [Thermovibrio ammonificans]|uniref:WYL domain-containing protein n=1 Tax=Thermovibrio ammonificans (strain DSM 15698 / JCM 12110 / HB-1) TaxID=648996 RepID=E8T5U0_THEA1|nr:WYL domain-containing protein [Thermovibrio ammonificans]ADU97666.1 hypothetical protein Theam_1710 [Thermovibrio ammonificans HB-1]